MPTPLDQFISDLRDLTTGDPLPDAELARITGELLSELVLRPGVVPDEFSHRIPGQKGRGYILHRSPTFTVSSVVWDPGDLVAPHSHETWGVVGVVSNGIEERRYDVGRDQTLTPREHHRHAAGEVSLLVPDDDVHSMHNLSGRSTVELHVYGKDISRMTRRGWSLDGGEMFEVPTGKYLNC